MSRYRLRFLLQEFDLPIGEVLIGRSPECHITIEDPLISRQHARIVVTPGGCTLEDLGSRNGSKVNGRLISGIFRLTDADRIRFGAQELVFFEVSSDRRSARATGAMLFCQRCATPFPEGARVCPHCGASAEAVVRDDETMSGVFLEPRRTWMLQLMGEVLDKALKTGRLDEAERILRRAVDEFDDRMKNGEVVEARQLALIADYAMRLAVRRQDTTWAGWVVDAFMRFNAVPPSIIVDRMTEIRTLPTVATLARTLVEHWHERSSELPPGDLASLERLDAIARASAD